MRRFLGSTALVALLWAPLARAEDPKAPASTPAPTRPAAALDSMTLPKPRVVELKNGARVLLVEQHRLPLVSFHAKLRGGSLGDPAGKEGLGSLTLHLLLKGAGARDASQFAEAMEDVGGELSVSAERESLDIQGQFMSRDTALMVELLVDMLLRPRFEQAELDKLRERQRASITSNKSNDPSDYLVEYFDAFHFGAHPYGRPVNGSETSLAAIERADVLAYAKNHLGGDRLLLAVVGDFDSKQLAQRLQTALGAWPRAAASVPSAPPPPVSTARRVLLVDWPGTTQTHFKMGNTTLSRTDPEYVRARLAHVILGGGPFALLMKVMREESGLTYGAWSSFRPGLQPGLFSMGSFTKTESTGPAVDLMLSVFERYRRQAPDDDTLNSGKQYMLGRQPTSLETSPQIAAKLVELAFYGLDASEVDGLSARVAGVRPDQLHTTLQRAMAAPETLDLVLLGDASALRELARKYGPVTEMSITQPGFSPAPVKPAP